jgi:hypothetical protein
VEGPAISLPVPPQNRHPQDDDSVGELTERRPLCGSRGDSRSAALPRIPVEICGVDALHAPFFTERRTRGPVHCYVAGNPGRYDKGEGGDLY